MKTDTKYPLEERTAKLGETVILFCKELKETSISKPLILQIVRSATSVGANYMEANGASSKMDFKTRYLSVKKNVKKPNTG